MRHRAKAPAVHKKKDFPPALQRLLHRVLKRKRKDRCLARIVIGHINNLHLAVIVRIKSRRLPFLAPGFFPYFRRRNRAGKYHLTLLDIRAHLRNFPCVVMRRLFLLVGFVFLVVNDNKPQVGNLRENRRAHADDNTIVSVFDLLPLLTFFFRR